MVGISIRQFVPWLMLGSIFVLVAIVCVSAAVSGAMAEIGAVLAGLVAVIVLLLNRHWVSYWVAAIAFIVLPPNVLELGAGVWGSFILVGLASWFAFRRLRAFRVPSAIWILGWYVASALVITFNAAATNDLSSSGLASTLFQVVGLIAVVALAVKRRGAEVIAKAFVGLCVVVAFSYAATLVLWLAFDYAMPVIGGIESVYGTSAAPVHFPFTVTLSSVQVFGQTVPRLTGFAREPGWMALYATVAFFLYPLIGWKRKLPRILIAVSVIGCLSTAGFGVFVVAIALSIFVAGNRNTWGARFAQRLLGAFLLGVGCWVAFFAPVLGLAAKEATNGESLDERNASTEAGLRALVEAPFGGGEVLTPTPHINLIASIAPQGILFLVFVSLAVLVPLWLGRGSRMAILPPVIAIYATLLGAQPSNGSQFVFVLVVITAAAGALNRKIPTVRTRPPSPVLSR